MYCTILAQPRSGSTYVRNIYKHVGFDFNMNHVGVVPTMVIVRDIRDAMLSYSIALNMEMKNREQIDQFLEGAGSFILQSASEILSAKYLDYNIPVLRYESFYHNPMIAFDVLRDRFNFDVDEDRALDAINSFSMVKMLDVQKKFADFSNWDRRTMIHGNHINGGDIRRWRYWFDSPEDLAHYESVLSDYLFY